MDTAEERLDTFLELEDPTPTEEQIADLDEEMKLRTPPDPVLDAGTHQAPFKEQRTLLWQVTDASSADWALRRIARARSRAAQAKQVHAEQQAQLDRWLKSETDRAERTEMFFTIKLEDWHRQSGEKSRKLPHGTVGLRKQQPEYDRDDAKLLAEATELELPIKRSPDWAAIKALLVQGPEISSGEHAAVVQGVGVVLSSVRILPRPDAFYVKTGGDVE